MNDPSSPALSDDPVLARARALWRVPDWAALAAFDDAQIESSAQRQLVAVMVACALQLQGEHMRAARWLRQSLAWGCPRRQAAELMLAGLHTTFGRIAALQRDDAGMRRHFREAAAGAGPWQAGGDPAAEMERRIVRELAALGQLTQAQGVLREQLQAIDNGRLRPGLVAARVEMLRSEVGLLQHELALAQQRARPGGSGNDGFESHLRRRSTSQLGQDLWVLQRSGFKRGGFFVEFGATDGVRLSNTYLLETEFGWSGICAEPNPKMFAELQRNRRCITTDACIGPRSGEQVEFVLAEEYGGMVSDMSNDMHAAKREAYFADAANRARFVTESLHDLLTRLGAPQEIDYLSIDTEGSEYAILSTFPFDRWNIRLISVEHNFGETRERVRELLEPYGYERTETKFDDWYERRS